MVRLFTTFYLVFFGDSGVKRAVYFDQVGFRKPVKAQMKRIIEKDNSI